MLGFLQGFENLEFIKPLLQSEEMRELANLTQDAAELLFEMTAMGDSGDAVEEMLQKAKQLQVSFTLFFFRF